MYFADIHKMIRLNHKISQYFKSKNSRLDVIKKNDEYNIHLYIFVTSCLLSDPPQAKTIITNKKIKITAISLEVINNNITYIPVDHQN